MAQDDDLLAPENVARYLGAFALAAFSHETGQLRLYAPRKPVPADLTTKQRARLRREARAAVKAQKKLAETLQMYSRNAEAYNSLVLGLAGIYRELAAGTLEPEGAKSTLRAIWEANTGHKLTAGNLKVLLKREQRGDRGPRDRARGRIAKLLDQSKDTSYKAFRSPYVHLPGYLGHEDPAASKGGRAAMLQYMLQSILRVSRDETEEAMVSLARIPGVLGVTSRRKVVKLQRDALATFLQNRRGRPLTAEETRFLRRIDWGERVPTAKAFQSALSLYRKAGNFEPPQ